MMNKTIETILAVLGIMMLLIALKVWLRIRKIKKTSIIVEEED